jgi:hypothetical protein
MDGILKELELIRQQKEAVEDQLQAMEKARHVKKGRLELATSSMKEAWRRA